MVAFRTPRPGDLAHNPDMCPDWEPNRLPFGLQACAQSTKPHEPGPRVIFEVPGEIFRYKYPVYNCKIAKESGVEPVAWEILCKKVVTETTQVS